MEVDYESALPLSNTASFKEVFIALNIRSAIEAP